MVNRSEESKEKQRQAQREKLQDPEFRAKQNAANKARYREKRRRQLEGLPPPVDQRYTQETPQKPLVVQSSTSKYYAEKLRKSKWGLTPEQYETLLAKQHNSCAICGCDLMQINPKYRHIDHNHTTGEIRGILCHSCNMGIGCLKDSQELLTAALHYLTTASTGLMKRRKY
jgi:hypothetical protein